MSNILQTFFILFETDAKRAASETENAVEGMAHSAEHADQKITASGAKRLATELASVAKRKQAELTIAEANHGVEAAVEHRAAAERAQTAARVAQAHAVVAAETEVAEKVTLVGRAAERAGDGFSEMASRAGAAIGAVLSLEYAIDGLKEAFTSVDRMAREADRFNINVEGYNAFNQVVEDMGGNAEKAERYLRRFADGAATAFGDADSAQGKAFKSLKVNLADANGDLKDTEQILVDTAGALEGLTKQQQLAKLKGLGVIDPAMRELLLGGRAKITNAFQGERDKGIITNEQVKVVHDFIEAWNDAKDEVAAFFNALAGNWAPGLTRFANNLQEFFALLRAEGEHVKNFAVGVTLALGAIAAVMWGSLIPAAIATAAAWAVIALPFIVIGAAIVALVAAVGLLWDDVQAFLKGQPSLIGDLIAKYGWLKKALDAIGAAFDWVKGVAGDVWSAIAAGVSWLADQLGRVFGPVFALVVDGFKLWASVAATVFRAIWAVAQAVFGVLWPTVIKPVLDVIAGGVRFLATVFGWVAQQAGRFFGSMFDGFVARVQDVIGWVRKLMGVVEAGRVALEHMTPGGGDGKPRPADAPAAAAQAKAQTERAVAQGKTQLKNAGAAPVNPVNSNAMAAAGRGNTTKTTTVKIDKVEVHTQATDADGMAKAASGALSSHLRRASDQFSDGVDR